MPQQPSWVHADSEPGQNVGTNETQPRFAGIADPGTVIKFSIDGKETTVVPTDEGSWTFDVPELENGDHEFEMWAEDAATGDESDRIEWENNVNADAQDRANQRARNAEWNKPGGEAEQFINKNDEFQRSQRGTPPSPVSGGGGSPQAGSGAGSGSGSGGSGSGGRSPTPGGSGGGSEEVGVGGVRSGSGGGGAPPAGLEKGNSGTIGYLPG